MFNDGKSIEEIANFFGASKIAIRKCLRTYGINDKFFNKEYFFSEKDEQFIKENYPKMGAKFCAQELNVSAKAIAGKANKLKIYRYQESIPEGHRRCYNCKKIAPFENFIKCQRNKCGYSLICIEMSKLYHFYDSLYNNKLDYQI